MFQQIKDWKPDEDEEDLDMDILKQCQKWHEESKQHKIIDALEAIPAEERTLRWTASWPAPITIWQTHISNLQRNAQKGPRSAKAP